MILSEHTSRLDTDRTVPLLSFLHCVFEPLSRAQRPSAKSKSVLKSLDWLILLHFKNSHQSYICDA